MLPASRTVAAKSRAVKEGAELPVSVVAQTSLEAVGTAAKEKTVRL